MHIYDETLLFVMVWHWRSAGTTNLWRIFWKHHRWPPYIVTKHTAVHITLLWRSVYSSCLYIRHICFSLHLWIAQVAKASKVAPVDCTDGKARKTKILQQVLNPTSAVGLSAPRWRRRTNPLAAAAGLFDLDRSSPWRRHPRKMRNTLVRRRPLLDLAPHGVGPLGCSPRRRDRWQRLPRRSAELPLSIHCCILSWWSLFLLFFGGQGASFIINGAVYQWFYKMSTPIYAVAATSWLLEFLMLFFQFQ